MEGKRRSGGLFGAHRHPDGRAGLEAGGHDELDEFSRRVDRQSLPRHGATVRVPVGTKETA